MALSIKLPLFFIRFVALRSELGKGLLAYGANGKSTLMVNRRAGVLIYVANIDSGESSIMKCKEHNGFAAKIGGIRVSKTESPSRHALRCNADSQPS